MGVVLMILSLLHLILMRVCIIPNPYTEESSIVYIFVLLLESNHDYSPTARNVYKSALINADRKSALFF